MNQTDDYSLTEEDRKAADIFVKLGMPKNLAKTLLYLSNVDECYSTDIESGAGLRQPEVSLAIKELENRGLIDKRVHKRTDGKGRPNDLYSLKVPITEVLKEFEEEKIEEINEVTNSLARLRGLIKNQ